MVDLQIRNYQNIKNFFVFCLNPTLEIILALINLFPKFLYHYFINYLINFVNFIKIHFHIYLINFFLNLRSKKHVINQNKSKNLINFFKYQLLNLFFSFK
jgi:hypothetical protein